MNSTSSAPLCFELILCSPKKSLHTAELSSNPAQVFCWCSQPKQIILQSITIQWMLSILARLLRSFAMLRDADENLFSFCLLPQELYLLSYTSFTVCMEKAKRKSFLQSLTFQLFWLQQLNPTDFHSKMQVKVLFGREGHSHFETCETRSFLVTISQAVDAPVFKHAYYS